MVDYIQIVIICVLHYYCYMAYGETNLRKNKVGNQSPWSDNELLAGFTYFYEQYGRYPSSHEIDAFDYLPSSRSIQRSYGGLQQLRRRLIPDGIDNFTRGEYRKNIASKTFATGRALEALFYGYLTTIFKEIAIHEHKLIRPGNVSCDFYIYLNENSGIVTDIFYADSIINLVNIVNIKVKRYILVQEETYLIVVGNQQIEQAAIDRKISNRQEPLPSHIKIVSEQHFKDTIIPVIIDKSNYCI